MKKYSTSKALIIAPYEVFREEVKRKFPVLDKIKILIRNTLSRP